MWWRSKKEKTNEKQKINLEMEGIKKLKAFRKRVETFKYFGVTMKVVTHSKTIARFDENFNNISYEVPHLKCNYVDSNGIIHDFYFIIDDLPILERENTNE